MFFDQNNEGYCHHCKQMVNQAEIESLPPKLNKYNDGFRICEYCIGEEGSDEEVEILYWRNWLNLKKEKVNIFNKLTFNNIEIISSEIESIVRLEIINNTGENIKSLSLRIIFYDNNGQGIGVARSEITQLYINETIDVLLNSNYDLSSYTSISYQCDDINF